MIRRKCPFSFMRDLR